MHVTLRSGAKKYVEFTHNDIQLHSADATDRILWGSTVSETRKDDLLLYQRTNLYISSPRVRRSAPPRISRWSRLFELRSLLAGAMTRTLTRIDETHPHICGNYIRSRNSRFVSFRTNVHNTSHSWGTVVQETWRSRRRIFGDKLARFAKAKRFF